MNAHKLLQHWRQGDTERLPEWLYGRPLIPITCNEGYVW